MNSVALRRFTLIALSLALALLARAQAPATSGGAIIGRVFNPANGEYIRNAEVRIQGTPLVAVSEDGGYYRLNNSPLGEVTVVATYLGHDPATARVTLA